MNERLPKVKILLSTYNGEKYLRELMDSLLCQTYSNVEIWVRDDGSTDGTLSILRSYAEDSKIHILGGGENLGFVQSFFTLLRDCGEADYFAFCDQDDVWYDEKIEAAVISLEREEGSIPLLYGCNYDICDETLHVRVPRALGWGKVGTVGFQNLIVSPALGFTLVFNAKAREMTLRHIPRHAPGHDWWMGLVCSTFGKFIFEDRTMVRYRRHKDATSSVGPGWKKVHEQLQEFWTLYAEEMNETDRKLLSLFAHRTFFNAIRKAFYPHRFHYSVIMELYLRGTFLLGRV